MRGAVATPLEAVIMASKAMVGGAAEEDKDDGSSADDDAALNEWEQLKARAADPEALGKGREHAWSFAWNESAAAALFRSAKLYSATGGGESTDGRLERLQREFLTPKLRSLWSSCVHIDDGAHNGKSLSPKLIIYWFRHPGLGNVGLGNLTTATTPRNP